MARRVYVHIGLPKTGTTFLQTTMWHNRRLMREHGLLYPGTNRMDHYHACQAIRGAAPSACPAARRRWDRIGRELAAWDGDGLVSHEFLSMASTRAGPARGAGAGARRGPRGGHGARLRPPVPGGVAGGAEDALRGVVRRLHGAGLRAAGQGSLGLALPGRRRPSWPAGARPCRADHDPGGHRAPARGAAAAAVGALVRGAGIDDTGFDLEVSYPNESLGAPQAALLLDLKPHLTGELLDGPVRHRWVRKYFGHEVLVPQNGRTVRPARRARARLTQLSSKAARVHPAPGVPRGRRPRRPVPPDDAARPPNPDDVTDARDARRRAARDRPDDPRHARADPGARQCRARAPPRPDAGGSAGSRGAVLARWPVGRHDG